MGKLFRLKAALSTFVSLKAAVKVNLPKSMLYDEVCLWTTVLRSTCGYEITQDILTSENQGQVTSARQSWTLPSVGNMA